MHTASHDDFTKLELRVGRVVTAEPLPGARVPAYKLTIDFGHLGTRTSSARITDLYRAEDLPGAMVVAVVNFSPKRIAGFVSETLVLGVDDEAGRVALLRPDRDVAPGQRVY